jgi:SAM-dependent methyltransferase
MRPFRWASQAADWLNTRRDLRFDEQCGVETVGTPGLDGPSELPPESKPYAQPYVPTATALFRRIVRKSRIDPCDCAFLDLGCGKGRTLLLACIAGFARVIGVEAEEHLCAVARQNVNRWAMRHKGVSPEIIHADARTTCFPPGNLFVYMFNPFTGPVFQEVVERLHASATEHSRAVIVLYYNDVCSEELERTGSFRRVRVRPVRFWTKPTISLFYNDLAWSMRRRR